MIEPIPTTSGFLLPVNRHYSPYDQDNSVVDAIYNRTHPNGKESALLAYYCDNKICNSVTMNNLSDRYAKDPSFDNLMALMNVAADILKSVDVKTFFGWQTGNPHITQISLLMCRDILTNRFSQTYANYSVVPFDSRFCFNNSVTADTASRQMKELFKDIHVPCLSWNGLFEEMLRDRKVFLTFFRYVFTDYY